ncbi:MAG TPA: hypothetical protein VF209_03055 [Patescibacteria group bacterium]
MLKNLNVAKLYLYVVSFISLFVVLFSAQAGLTTLFRYFVFQTAPEYQWQPPAIPFGDSYYAPYPRPAKEMLVEQEETATELIATGELTEEEKQTIELWLNDYRNWVEEQENQRQRVKDGLIDNIVSIAVFLPAFLFHFYYARKS